MSLSGVGQGKNVITSGLAAAAPGSGTRRLAKKNRSSIEASRLTLSEPVRAKGTWMTMTSRVGPTMS